MVSRKSIPEPGFAGDSGTADPALTAALAAHAADRARLPEVLAALHGARVLAPVVAVLGEREATAAGLTVDKSADIALPLLVADDGARAVPVFSGLLALARWDPRARPVPVEAARAAAVVLAERAEALVLDVAGPRPVTLGLPEVRALVAGRGRVPAYDDESLRVALHHVLAGMADVAAAWLGPADGVDARVTVAPVPGAAAEDLAARLAGELAPLTSRVGVRGWEVALTSPGQASQPSGRRVFTRAPRD